MSFPWWGFVEGYDALTSDIARAMHNSLPFQLARWFAYLEEYPEVAAIVRELEAPVDFDEWIGRANASAGGEIGTGVLPWSKDGAAYLGQRLALTRAFSDERLDAPDFCMSFMWGRDTSGEGSTRRVIEQIFEPTLRDLKRHLGRRLDDSNIVSEAPASDRVVRLDHNSATYRDLVLAVNRLDEAVRGENGFESEEEKQRAEAEIAASRTLLALPVVRESTLQDLLGGVAIWLGRRFQDMVVGVAANFVYGALQRLLTGQ